MVRTKGNQRKNRRKTQSGNLSAQAGILKQKIQAAHLDR